mmetsp:Transcript_34905/g.68943  ORF Transcript_34905/g.68943 Transcript_34905/m.68943 type:complete len:104 (+) Transcript_34905:932-1243(+)
MFVAKTPKATKDMNSSGLSEKILVTLNPSSTLSPGSPMTGARRQSPKVVEAVAVDVPGFVEASPRSETNAALIHAFFHLASHEEDCCWCFRGHTIGPLPCTSH